jgi:galactan endo-1,6-beta-galactosidase
MTIMPGRIARLLRQAVLVSMWVVSLMPVRIEAQDATLVVSIRPDDDHGTWQAWGTSLCWWAGVFGDRSDLADLLFTRKSVRLLDTGLPGLGMNYARYNAGACSWNEIDGRKMVVSKIILPYRQMEGFWLDGKHADPESPGWDWSVDRNQRAMLRMAKERGADHLELFSNSPMWWMCRNDNPSGAAVATNDNLHPDRHADFAIYLAEIARRAKRDWGVAFTTVSPFNEPSSRWWDANCKQEGCHFERHTQESFLPVLRRELDRRGMRGVDIAASDENTYDEALDTWNRLTPGVREMIAQINVHGYQGGNGRRRELHDAAARAGRRLWNSEYGDERGDGMTMARNLHLDFAQLRPTAWAYWQPFDIGGWGLVQTDFRRKAFRRVNPKYHVLAQYTRHIRPGMELIGSSSPDVVAAFDRTGRRLALVVLNEGDERPLEVDLSRLRTGRASATRWVTTPHGDSCYELRHDVTLDNGTLHCSLPARSVVTIEVAGIGN